MNFVDVQPQSFLDYAWTTPSPAPASIAKPSKTSRKQNRCCDQCRKGKRACDAAILEDTLLDTSAPPTSGGNPTVFHYSDVFGPLAPCGNCEKTKKSCTFEWLRSQRVSQAAPQPNSAPPAKKRRKSSESNNSQKRVDPARQMRSGMGPNTHTLMENGTSNGGSFVPRELGETFADFPTGTPLSHMSLAPSFPLEPALDGWHDFDPAQSGGMPIDRDSGKGSSVESQSDQTYESIDSESPFSQSSSTNGYLKPNTAVIRAPRKKKRRLFQGLIANGRIPSPYTDTIVSSADSSFLTEGLLKIYHDSFETALSCWLTERTCPYSKDSDVALADDSGPDWNRIYHRVFKLDRLASGIRGRNLTLGEDKAASKAINAAIFSFATQWAQSSERSKSKYPFHSQTPRESARKNGQNGRAKRCREPSPAPTDFDRNLQVSAWHEARMALQNASEIESFRVVLAQIVFSLTQKPIDTTKEESVSQNGESRQSTMSASPTDGSDTSLPEADSPSDPDDKGVSECEDLLSKLNLTIDGEGPPIHLEQGLRLIHSLRSRMAMSRSMGRGCGRQPNPSSERLDAADRATVDLLFWLGIMFDTLSSAMHKRPLVVSDEDSDIYANEPRPATNGNSDGSASPTTLSNRTTKTEGLWDDYLFARQRKRLQGPQVRWPCSNEQATSLLCDAAPVKVLLFRKVTRIQTLLSRNVRGERMEKAMREALSVYDHWGKLYDPFIRDCIANHDDLPSRVQSWYICLTGHWHLATLLLADLVEIIDGSEVSVESQRLERMATDFVATFRERNCNALSDLARCACPRDDASFSNDGEYHFAVNQGAILTEPWTVVMIKAFAKAGVHLLESSFLDSGRGKNGEDSFRRADDCVKALWYLGRKSDMALLAADTLGSALKKRRKEVEEIAQEMNPFVNAQLWDGFDDLNNGMMGEEGILSF
ncbi:hypothetical protein K469DRAFT_626628 [Zopfia rhizophila CBS 207.26]|uniref:Zn(2)-C6 fungal-type domain-containing protein n=1 Tax=Zopfia rhizophila CBS 207.26 TaxID=1314779 RepID=A0A6A6ECH5_9PEZI|nr:hypothetical protein K469DRAFT_626628 [Zopfia rhizophila CBS 207.26]